MMNTAPEHWCRAYMKLGSNCDSVDNNMCESFNNWILEARYLPCISMLEWIRQKNMVRIQENRTKAEKWEGTICPNVFKKLKQNIKRSGTCDVLWNGKEGFEVLEHEKFKFTVNLEAWTCSCRYWQLSGLPCCHAISAIYKTGRKIDDYIAKCYSIEVYNKIYSHCLEPLEGEESWPRSDRVKPAPPGYISLPGRPKTERRREEGEAPKGNKMRKIGGTITCSPCHRTGHNMKSCTNNGAGKHQGNSHIVRDAARKRKQDKDAMEAENAKKTKAAVEAANAKKEKGVAQSSSQPHVQIHENLTSSQPSRQGKSQAGVPNVPAKQAGQNVKKSMGKSQAGASQAGRVKHSSMQRKSTNVGGSQPSTSQRKSTQGGTTSSSQPNVPKHCVFNLAAYKKALESKKGPSI
ncbi:uncharacterized protein [Triticum aestivum]|uniref:uncharacterized protein n=1 Tax=Triticum aestivum TaxID=4565 RepID=UPI001D0044AA|nr:uncharacterized protein LOC123113149 [Triticum aestivum]